VNWYLYSNLRVMINYVYAHVKNTGSDFEVDGETVHGGGASGNIHTAQARAQIEF